jgi:hypothetical protein
MFLGGKYGRQMIKLEKILAILSEERNAEILANYNRDKGLSQQFLLLETIDGNRFVFDSVTGDILVRENFETK